MNKKVIYFLLLLFLISLIIVLFDKDDRSKNVSDEETRAVYFSYIEFSNYITDKSDSEQKKNIITILNNIKSLNFNRIIVHVRPFSDSIYVSNYYPISQYVLNDKGKYPSYDILKFFIDEAHKRNIKFDAWINPYRISNLKNPSSLSFNSIYFKYKDTDMLGVTESGIYFNPASSNAQQLIINGIIEIVKNGGSALSEIRGIKNESEYEVEWFGKNFPREELYDRINKRVDKMLENGMIEETQTLLKKHGRIPNITETIGYREIISYLDGKLTLEDALNQLKQNTRRYAKRQLTWFRRNDKIKWDFYPEILKK